MVEEEKMSEEEIVEIIKILIRLLGSSIVNPGKRVKAVHGIKKELEADMAGRDPIKSIHEYQVNFGFH
jgi:hypothetical protein